MEVVHAPCGFLFIGEVCFRFRGFLFLFFCFFWWRPLILLLPVFIQVLDDNRCEAVFKTYESGM